MAALLALVRAAQAGEPDGKLSVAVASALFERDGRAACWLIGACAIAALRGSRSRRVEGAESLLNRLVADAAPDAASAARVAAALR